MTISAKSLGFKATAIALVAATSLTMTVPAFAGGRHHGGGGGWSYGEQRHGGYNRGYNRGYDRGYDRGSDDNDNALAAVAIIGGVILGAAALSAASQPSYYTPPPQTVYAPAPSYGYNSGYGNSSYDYEQPPIQAVPSSDVYQAQSGQYCREYQSQANIGGQMTYGYGTACLQPDGSWRVVN